MSDDRQAQVDESKVADLILTVLPWIKESPLSRVFTEDNAVSTIIFLIETIKKAWQFGKVESSEFSRFINLLKNPHILSIIPFILGCYRLNQQMEIAAGGFSQMADICTLVMNQATNNYDVYVPSRMMLMAETYYRVTPDGSHEYIIEQLKKAPIFRSTGFWEAYLLWSVQRTQKDQSHFERESVDAFSLRHNAQEGVSTVFLTLIYEMKTAGVDSKTAKSIISTYMDRLRFNEKTKARITSFLNDQFGLVAGKK